MIEIDSEKVKINFGEIKGQNFLTIEQIESFLDVVISECDRFFPVFYVFFNKKKSPKNAIEIAMLETCGEA